jgi:hypothetical protein
MIEICEGFMILRVFARRAEDRMCLDFARINSIVSMEDLYASLMGKTYT